jgi:CTP synthase
MKRKARELKAKVGKNNTKYIFVVGGVLSGVGKGISAASIGNILKARGLSVSVQKCDPYLNVDAGTLNPAEHGECFVTKDGAETDLDLGHYERFLDIELTQDSSLMSGRLLLKLIQDERAGKFLGKTVQVIPHLTNSIKEHIIAAGEGSDIHIVEMGGTVGDYESLSFVEAFREFAFNVGRDRCLFVHVVYMPYLGASQEVKSKPAQNAVRDLRGFGIVPDVLVARSESKASPAVINKLSMFSGVAPEAIALLPNAKSIYEVPLTLEDEGLGDVICKRLGIKSKKVDLKQWRDVVKRATTEHGKTVTVGVVAKYMDNTDTYMSVFEALRAAALWQKVNLEIRWVDAEKLEKSRANVANEFKGCDGIVVPGGFGMRGVEGKIKAAQYALESKVPYLGLCLGMQVGLIASARNAGIKATTTELDPKAEHQVIHTMNDQKGKENTGGTMRLGNYDCKLDKNSKAALLYGTIKIVERHRHRYEANNSYRDQYESWGIKPVGINVENNLVEVIEAINHPFFIASQFHPEFKSRPNKPHPMFTGFIQSIK